MNERIRELAEQAGFHVAPYEGINDNNMIEKFAELIVRECMAIASEEEGHSPFEGPVETKIKQHFRVLE